MQKKQKDKVLSSYAQNSRFLGLGMHFAISTLFGTGVGWWLDGWLSTLPLFLLVGMFFGAGAGFYHLYKTLMEMQEREKREGEAE